MIAGPSPISSAPTPASDIAEAVTAEKPVEKLDVRIIGDDTRTNGGVDGPEIESGFNQRGSAKRLTTTFSRMPLA